MNKINHLGSIGGSLLALSFLAVLIIPAQALASIAGLPLVPLVAGETQADPRIYASNVVYADYNGSGWGLSLVNTASNKQTTIASGIGYQVPSISGTNVAYSTGDSVYLYDINTGATTKIPNPQIPQADTINSSEPSIDGNYIVFITAWTVSATGQSGHVVTLYNIATGESKQITDIGQFGQYRQPITPSIQGNKVVYEETMNNQNDIYLYDISSGQSSKIGTAGFSPNIYGDYVIWTGVTGTSPIILYKISAQTQKTIGTGAGMGGEISGDNVVYWSSVDRQVHLYKISSGNETVGFGDGGGFTGPDIYGNTIVWADNRNSPSGSPTQQTNIYYAKVSDNGVIQHGMPQ